MRRVAAGALAAAVAGCAPVGGGPVVSRAPPEAGAPPAAGALFATELAGPETYLPPLPTAVILLRPDDMERNRAFCRAALALPTVQQAEAASVVAPNLIHTRWLVQVPDVPAARAADCDFLTGVYDYARAGRLIASIQPGQGSLGGRGPFLLMLVPDPSGLHVAGLDGSATPDAAFGGFIGGWGRALADTQVRVAAAPAEQHGVVRSLFALVGAVLRGVVGGTVGLVTGVLNAA